MKRIFLLITAAAVVCLSVAAQNQKVMNGKNTLVAYFSATGITEKVAEMIAEATGGTLYEITPEQEYSDADLNWRDESSRSSVEMHDLSFRPAIVRNLENAGDYDVIYIGFPIWWNLAPTEVNTFIEAYGFEGKTVIPFATSGGSGITNSAAQLKKQYPDINWQSGKLLNNPSKADIEAWVK